jgi:hypothetical protein
MSLRSKDGMLSPYSRFVLQEETVIENLTNAKSSRPGSLNEGRERETTGATPAGSSTFVVSLTVP